MKATTYYRVRFKMAARPWRTAPNGKRLPCLEQALEYARELRALGGLGPESVRISRHVVTTWSVGDLEAGAPTA